MSLKAICTAVEVSATNPQWEIHFPTDIAFS
jgi:hypothetical protein